ncbi:MAG TPA: MFS transporter [Candidatus Acidoferrales bacterium]|nr:MFS transporter [Candidatus Acidoferrales bacterium]
MADTRANKITPAFWVPTLYFAEGLPFVTINVVSVLMYKSMKVPDAQIAFFTTLVILPWTLKPFWGPLLEMFKTKKYFVLATQFIGGVGFGLLALTLRLPNFFQWSLVLLAIIAFNGSTHDIAADGVYINSLTEKEQAKYVGWQGAFYNVAKVLSQGAFVYIAGRLEITIGVVQAWMLVMAVFGGILILLSLYHSRMLPIGGEAGQVKTARETFATFWDVVKTFFGKRYIAWGIAFIILYRFAEGQAMKIVPLFMRADRVAGGLGLSTSQIGIIYGFFPPAAFILGSMLAGYFISKRGLKKSLVVLCTFFNIPFVVYCFLSFMQPTDLFTVGTAVVFEYFGYGFGFVGLTLYMMQQIAPGKYKMAHYAFATGVMNLGLMIPSALSGFISDFLGYKNFFLWVMVATIPSFLVAWRVPFREVGAEASAEIATEQVCS